MLPYYIFVCLSFFLSVKSQVLAFRFSFQRKQKKKKLNLYGKLKKSGL